MAKMTLEIADLPDGGMSVQFNISDPAEVRTIATNTATQNLSLWLCRQLEVAGVKIPPPPNQVKE